MTLATYDEIKDAVDAIQAENDSFKPLIMTLGGAHWIATTVHATMVAFANLGWDAMEGVVETALSVPAHMDANLSAFVERLFDVLQDGAEAAADGAENVAGDVAAGTGKVAMHTQRGVLKVTKAVGKGLDKGQDLLMDGAHENLSVAYRHKRRAVRFVVKAAKTKNDNLRRVTKAF